MPAFFPSFALVAVRLSIAAGFAVARESNGGPQFPHSRLLSPRDSECDP
jgi:hypothetical protein